jgi:hypothetical protein
VGREGPQKLHICEKVNKATLYINLWSIKKSI